MLPGGPAHDESGKPLIVDPTLPAAESDGARHRRGDPLAFAPHVFAEPFAFADGARPPANVLVTFAHDDESMSNVSTQALLRALGVPVAEPTLAGIDGVSTQEAPIAGNMGQGTGAAVEYAPATRTSRRTERIRGTRRASDQTGPSGADGATSTTCTSVLSLAP